MIHGWRNGDAGWHFVVEQTTNSLPQRGLEKLVTFVITCAGMRINAAGQIAFQGTDDVLRLLLVFSNNKQRRVTESFSLEDVSRCQELLAGYF